jgi:hypothetical protein
MPAEQRKIIPSDIISDADYAAKRKELRAAVIALKKDRRMEVGPYVTFYFENYDTMLSQVQEMLRIEKGGAEQIAGELEAYNPLIPQGLELIATVMVEIEDGNRRARELAKLGHIEDSMFLEIGTTKIKGTPTEYEDRTTADGKTSSVHWIRFTFTPELAQIFKVGGQRVLLGVDHPNYGHMATMPTNVRAALSLDLA